MIRLKSLAAVFALTVMGFGMQACNKDSDTENAIEDVADDVGDGIHDAGDEVQDTVEDATE